MIHLHESKNKQFYFTVVASNGNVLCTSETYTRKSNLKKGIQALLRLLASITWPSGFPYETKVVDHTKKKKK